MLFVLFIIVTFAKFNCGLVRVTAADDRVMSIIHRAHSPVKLIKYVLWCASHHALLGQQQHSGTEPSVSWWSIRWIRSYCGHVTGHAAIHTRVFCWMLMIRSCDEPHLALVCQLVLFACLVQHVSQLSYGDHASLFRGRRQALVHYVHDAVVRHLERWPQRVCPPEESGECHCH